MMNTMNTYIKLRRKQVMSKKKLTKGELKKLSDALEILEREIKLEFGLHRLSGGFVTIEMFDYDNKIIDLQMKSGTQDDGGDYTQTDQLKMDRKTLKLIE